MAEAIVGPLLSKVQEVVVKEAKALAAVGGEIDKLRDKLVWLQALVHEADLRSRHDGSRLVRVLACQIRDAGFEVEDAVDQFYLRGSLSRRFGRRNWWRISKEFIFNFRTHFSVRVVLSRRIRSMNVRLEEIVGNSSTYTLSSQSGSGDGKTWKASRAIPPMREDWDKDYSREFVLKCRKDEEETMERRLKKSDSEPEVITVVGVEGVGKTALLTHASKKESINKVFNVRIWLSFSPDIGDKCMLQQIKEELGNKAMGKDPKEVRYLVVIDSPVSTMTWHKVEGQLLEMVGEGSKIVLSLTSSWSEEKKDGTIKQKKNEKGSKTLPKNDEGTSIKLRPLNESNSKTLFNHVYGLDGRRRTKYQTAEMNHIRSKIMEITNGLPLAVVLLAKLMRTMDFGKWEAAADYLKCNSEDNKLKTILTVCVDDLSDELKSCLLYTAGFPEKRPIDAHQLVRLWMAEGFLTQQHKLETEQLGQCYLKELIYRGLLQLITKQTSAHGGHVQWVAIPEQIHPLLRSEAQRTSFLDVHYGGCLPPPGNTRRLALHNYNDKFPALDNCLDKLRTVVSYSDDYTDYPNGLKQEKSSKDEPEPKLYMREFLLGSPYLRVINLEGIEVVKEKKKGNACALPHEIGEMVHLQYLGVRCRRLKKVPSSVGNLGNLQTIDVRGTSVRKLPKSLWKIKTLRHVLGDELAFPRSTGDLKLMHTLETVTINHLDDDQCSTAAVAAWKRGKEARRRRLRFLHRLHVAKLDVSQGEALRSVLEGLSSLEALILSGDHIPMDLFAVEASDEATASCLKHVESLKLDGQLHLQQDLDYSRLHSCLVDLTHLVLRSTKIGQDFICCIGELPVLAELELLEGSYEHDEMTFCAHEFHCLTLLKISGLDGLKKISVPGATTRRNKKDIKTDVPDHVEIVRVETDKHQQPGTSNDHSHSHSGTHEAAATTTTTTHREEDGNPSPPNPLTKMILEAVGNNKTTKTAISNYINGKHRKDPMTIYLDYMVSRKLIDEQETKTKYKKYLLNQASPGLSVQETAEQNVVSSSTEPQQD